MLPNDRVEVNIDLRSQRYAVAIFTPAEAAVPFLRTVAYVTTKDVVFREAECLLQLRTGEPAQAIRPHGGE